MKLLLASLSLYFVIPLHAQEFRQENTASNLKAYMEHLYKSLHQDKDLAKAKSQFKGFFLNESRAKAALRDDISSDTLKLIAGFHQKMSGSDADLDRAVKGLCKANQSEVQVHASTTEEIMLYKEGSVAFKEFPGACKDIAVKYLRPKSTYYEVEFLEPGKEAGMKYHLFFWDGKQWSMLGPIWRELRK